MSNLIEVSLEMGVLDVRLNRPDKKNALTNAMYGALADALERAQTDDAVRCVILSGVGGAFTAGNDLGDFAAVASGALPTSDMQVGRIFAGLLKLDKPLVAAVEGVAVGIGTTLLLHCDLVYLAESATLSAPFVDLALVPEAASSLLMPARIGHVRAFALFALGERMQAADALALGLANALVPDGSALARAQQAAAALASKAPSALQAAKRLMRPHDQVKAQLAVEQNVFQRQLRSPEAREAFSAFAERRRPVFKPA